jgi:ubiquinone biosynthesis protein COQ9
LLKYALPLVKVHGFTRETLARSVLHLPLTETRTNTHVEPLSDTAVSALFGEGDEARRTLISAWLQDGLRHMGTVQGVERPTIIVKDEKEEFDTAQSQYPQIGAAPQATSGTRASIKDVLHARLKYNEPALSYLPEVGRPFLKIMIYAQRQQAFAILISPSLGIPPIGLQPALKHAAQVADTACFVTGDKSLQVFFLPRLLRSPISDCISQFEWYARRACIATVYAAAGMSMFICRPFTNSC